LLQDVLCTRTTTAWLEILRGHVPCAPVYTVEEALCDEQVLAREMVVEVEHAQLGRLREVGCPIKIDGVTPRYDAASALGADTEAILRALLGLSDTDIADLRAAGAI
jgi:crotonobetainyl-CoA:carnitine CoA-transferase CaiB-like acyl-CoA transferase